MSTRTLWNSGNTDAPTCGWPTGQGPCMLGPNHDHPHHLAVGVETSEVQDRRERRGDWMQTYTGRAFWPLDPRVEEIDPLDIAHALSMICRYGGHAHRFYSVAEHCWLMSYAVAPEHALWALLHDATEAYVGDMVRPLKRSMPAYVAAEDHLMRVICDRFGLDYAFPPEVKAADNRILLDERAAVMTPPPLPWNQDEASVTPLGVKVQAYMPPRAREVYLDRLRELLHD